MAYVAPAEFVTRMVDAGESKLLMSTRDTLIRAYMAGAILALAAAFAVTVTVNTGNPLLGAILFPVGFILLYLMGFDLLTGVFTLAPLAVIDKRPGATWAGVLRNWGLVFVGNFAGAITVAVFMAISFTFGRKTGRTLTGSPAECCAAALEAAGAAALGLNCSPSPEDMLGLLRAMRRVSALPVVVQPNAGMPETAPDGSTFYPYSPEKMRECARALLEAGASAIGGCCGTTFDHIRALKPLTGGPVPAPAWDGQARLCSRRDCATVTEALEAVADLSDPEDAYDLEGDETAVRLDLRGLAPDEAAVRTLDASAATRLPLILRADDADALRAALLACPGRPAADAPADLRPIIDEFGAFPVA